MDFLRIEKHRLLCISSTIVTAFLVCIGFATAAPFMLNEQSYENKLSPLGEKRILAICLPKAATLKSKFADPLYASIDWQGFEERDLVIAEIRKDTGHIVGEHQRGETVVRYIFARWNYNQRHSNKNSIEVTAKCDNKLEYVLIGKDQTEKKRWDLFPSNNELYSLIDAMPMRRFEMRQKQDEN